MGNCWNKQAINDPRKDCEGTSLRPSNLPLPPLPLSSLPCPRFDLNGQWVWGYCTDVYDGDTCTMNVRLTFGDFEFKVRLAHLDSPEMKIPRGSSKACNGDEKVGQSTPKSKSKSKSKPRSSPATPEALEIQAHSKTCKQILSNWILHKYCVLNTQSWDKYGRLLAEIYVCPSETGYSVSCVEEDARPNPSTLLNVNQWMLQHTSCVPYEGGTKIEWAAENLRVRPYAAEYNAEFQRIRQSS